MSAAEKVLGTVELIEQILLYSQLFELFRLQRVNCTFNTVIAESPELRRTMLLEHTAGNEPMRLNPLLVRDGGHGVLSNVRGKRVTIHHDYFSPWNGDKLFNTDLTYRFCDQKDGVQAHRTRERRIPLVVPAVQGGCWYIQSPGSWREMKVLSRALPLRVVACDVDNRIHRAERNLVLRGDTLADLSNCLAADNKEMGGAMEGYWQKVDEEQAEQEAATVAAEAERRQEQQRRMLVNLSACIAVLASIAYTLWG
ncbi:hypothetical protein LTR08_001410 [Meristemomyces frigidus]|nr:hypothetical protein LTR08_001410 [Meristemomyces frigidus]